MWHRGSVKNMRILVELTPELLGALEDGYRRKPQEPDFWAEAVTRDSIASEPW